MRNENEDLLAARAAEGGEEKRAYVQQLFSQIAPRYDLLNHVLSFNIDRSWRTKAIRELDIARSPAGKYLDLCAGTLDISAAIARGEGFRGSILAADFAEPMLRAGVSKIGAARISPVTADALDLPIAPSSMAGAIVAFGIRNVADLDACLREVHRVLEPRARFVILEFSTPRSSIVRSAYHFYSHNILPAIGQLVSGHGTAYRYLPKSVANFPAEEELARRMSAAGFANLSWRSLTMGVAAIHVGQKSV